MVEIALKRTKLPSGVDVFYREAGSPQKPTILLLHGFPNSSFYFRNLIPLLAPNFHLVAPDLAGFGFTTLPAGYVHTFEHMGDAVYDFVQKVLPAEKKFSIYIFDYGAPAGLRAALKTPERIEAIITQNGNAYEVGLGPVWQVVRNYWKDPSPTNREIVRQNVLGFEAIKGQYFYGVPEDLHSIIAPETYTLDTALTSANAEAQLDLMLDYENNIKLYPAFQSYLKEHKPRVLAVWGKNDPFFIPAGANAWVEEQGIKGKVHLLDTGHLALETNWVEIAKYIGDFLQ